MRPKSTKWPGIEQFGPKAAGPNLAKFGLQSTKFGAQDGDCLKTLMERFSVFGNSPQKHVCNIFREPWPKLAEFRSRLILTVLVNVVPIWASFGQTWAIFVRLWRLVPRE